jgi:uncharacterized protein
MAENKAEKELRAAINAVVRSDAKDDAKRREVIERAAAAKLSGLIPDNWGADGELKDARGVWDSQEKRDTANDVFAGLASAVADAYSDEYGRWYVWVQDWYGTLPEGGGDPEYTVVYCAGDELYAAQFSYDDDHKIVLGEPIKVRPVTQYVERSAPGAHLNQQIELRKQRAAMLEGAPERRRFAFADLELRETSDGAVRFSGYASVTEHEYEVGDFTEVIARQAFKRTLSEDPHVVLLINHGDGGSGLPLASTRSGTLTLSEDVRGLRVDADLNPDDPDAALVIPKMRRKDVEEMSFAFRATDQAWNEDYSHRTIKSVAMHRGDVSIVTMGANPATTSTIQARDFASALVEVRAGKALSTASMSVLNDVLGRIASADQDLDEAQPMLAELMGVPNPDAEDSDDGEAESGDDAETSRASWDSLHERRERLAVLAGGVR